MINPKSEIRNPKSLWIVRHGESTANVARRKAELENSLTIDFIGREMDIPLSEIGVSQAISAGKWFLTQSEKPTVVFASPYMRTFETARFIAEHAGIKDVGIFHDERIREREFGIFDRLTWRGSVEKFPDEMAKREAIGKFYYRPPGGESWCDVALRVRNFWRDLYLNHPDERILVVTHEVVVRIFRYVVERMTEAEILAIDKASDILNGAITSYHLDTETSKLALKLDNFVP
jgi:broad specificity phosphatase PhoE